MHPHTQQAGVAGLSCPRGLGCESPFGEGGGLIFPPVSLLSEHLGG